MAASSHALAHVGFQYILSPPKEDLAAYKSIESAVTFRDSGIAAASEGRAQLVTRLGLRRAIEQHVVLESALAPSSAALLKSTESASRTATRPLAEWHGQVTEVGDHTFSAELRGKFGQGIEGASDEALIPIDEISADDLPLLQPGAFFRLCVGYEIRTGTKRRYTEVVFRRMPCYRQQELDAARTRADELWAQMKFE